jgi:hypothetical protein
VPTATPGAVRPDDAELALALQRLRQRATAPGTVPTPRPPP